SWSDAALIAERADALRFAAVVGLGAAAAMAALVALLLGRLISRPLSTLSGAIARLARGEPAEVAGAGRGDEIGVLARSLSVIHAAGVEAAQIRSALESSSACLLIADAEERVVYVSTALERLLADAPEPLDAREAIGGSAAAVMGPAAELAGAGEARRDRAALRGLDVDVAANPILDGAGARIGAVVELRDVTADLRLEREIDALVAAARDGDFSRRIDGALAAGRMGHVADALNGLVENVESNVDEIRRMAERLAEGDLTAQAEGDFRGAFEEMRDDLNGAVTRLGATLSGVVGKAARMRENVQAIQANVGELASRAEGQASSLEETAATMEEMTATIRENADHAEKASTLSAEAAERASRGGEVVEETVTAMSRIEDSSTRISDIITVIDGIAFQTNLLALNAAVEAARAGDAGKGFAVVASEVRTLAQRSAEAAKDIKELIAESAGHVSSGVELVNRTGSALSEIFDSIRGVSDTVQAISTATREQSAGVSEISSAVSHMDEGTQQTAARAEETARAAGGVATLAAELADSVAQFQVGADQADAEAFRAAS
ncbi:MAG: methyl-accepting chemotaxis protein, partial [Pseudomonadota bacterium]